MVGIDLSRVFVNRRDPPLGGRCEGCERASRTASSPTDPPRPCARPPTTGSRLVEGAVGECSSCSGRPSPRSPPSAWSSSSSARYRSRAPARRSPTRLRRASAPRSSASSSFIAARSRVHGAGCPRGLPARRLGAVARGSCPRRPPSSSALAVLVLAALVLALYRQVGILTLRVGPGVALELAEEGPELGRPAPHLEQLVGCGPRARRLLQPGLPPVPPACSRRARARRARASPSTSSTRTRSPKPSSAGRSRARRSRCTWSDGIVAAKGTANTLEQLEQLIAIGAGEDRVCGGLTSYVDDVARGTFPPASPAA